MDTFNLIQPLLWWQQKVPRALKPNCLITRYPVYFFSEPKTLLEFCDPWNGIPQFLRNHGYEVRAVSKMKQTRLSKGHLIVAGDEAIKIIRLLHDLKRPSKFFSSITLVDPIFNLAYEQDLIKSFTPPTRLLFGSVSSKQSVDPEALASQRIAKSWGPSFDVYDGTAQQLRGRGPRPSESFSASEFFLQHCIFLAEYDLTTAQ